MIRFTFEAKFPDGSPRRLAGTHRPPWQDVRDIAVQPVGGLILYSESRVEKWREGVFDVPIYHLEEDE